MHTIRYHNFYLYTISLKAIAYGVMLEIKKYDCNTEVILQKAAVTGRAVGFKSCSGC